jgi:hypothetical protein
MARTWIVPGLLLAATLVLRGCGADAPPAPAPLPAPAATPAPGTTITHLGIRFEAPAGWAVTDSPCPGVERAEVALLSTSIRSVGRCVGPSHSYLVAEPRRLPPGKGEQRAVGGLRARVLISRNSMPGAGPWTRATVRFDDVDVQLVLEVREPDGPDRVLNRLLASIRGE